MKTVPLGELADFIMGQAPPGERCNLVGDGTPFVKAGEFGERHPIIREWTTRPLQLAERGDVLVCVVGATCGKVNFGADCAIGRSVGAVRPRSGRLHQVFAYHFLRAQTLRLRSGSQGSAQGVITRGMLEALHVPALSLPEQRRIADTLDKADAIRRKRKQAIALTEDLLRSAFLDMFGDPVANPKGWPVKPLGEMATKISDGTHKTPLYVESGVPFLSAKNVRAHRIDWERTKFITGAEHQDLIRRCRPERGDVVLTKSGTIGEAAVIDRETEFSLFESVALIKLPGEGLSPAFLAEILNNPSVRKLYGADVKGVGVKHLHLVDIRRLPTICPPRAAQGRYERFVAQLSGARLRAEAGLATAESLFNSLIQRAFHGEGDLADAALDANGVAGGLSS